ncbi:hypothetical protein [Arthrobacter sp. 49Tsu3.1M3]|uniref:hypothetical protein n=1 Tax=Arthrobacter sp. 49Tsu3.1M3 TaxID=1279029 RepID=UPI001177F7E1|nr:hypothetical protein [Arthrobacter sp. 49Tsu3.1M3]
MNDLVQALREVRSNHVRDEYSTRVKRLVEDHLTGLQNGAKIEDTLYFNHSAIPDFVMTWDSGKNRRDVYIRSSYAAIMAANEPEQIRTGDPIFVSLDEQQTYAEPGFEITQQDLVAATTNAKHTLLTDPSALMEISAPADNSNPLASVVKSNFLRGARGLVDESVAEALVHGLPQAGGTGVSDLIRDKFFDDAVFRMERTAALVQWALADAEDDSAVDSLALEGRMSTEELRNVLPWILRQETSNKNSTFWARLGAMMTFEQLEQIASEIEGIDVTPLIRANAHHWSARRCYLGLNVTEDGSYPENPTWRFSGGTLGLGIRELMVRVSYSGNKLKSRPGSSSPRWETVKSHFSEYKLQSVSLSGIERSLRVEAKQSDDINKDVAKVADSVEDDYFVEKVELNLSVPGGEENEFTSVEVDFAGSLASTNKPAELASLTRVGLNVIGYGREQRGEDLTKVLGSDSGGTSSVDHVRH